jgi:hypothetical protein
MKRIWKIAGIATLVAILGVAVVGAAAFAQDDDGSGWPFDFHTKFRESIAKYLKIDVETYDAAVEQAREEVLGEALAEGWLTEDQAERMKERFDQGFGARGMGKGFLGPHRMDKGFVGPRGGFMGRGGNSLLGMIAHEADLSVQELFAELQDGKSLADLASEKGVDVQAVTGKYLAQLEENLTQAVTDGKMTQNQADWMLNQAKEMVPDLLSNTWEGCAPGGFRGGRRPGRMWGFPGKTDA